MNSPYSEQSAGAQAHQRPKTAVGRFARHLQMKWAFLRHNQAYQKTPVRALLRLLTWRLRCWLQLPAVIDLPRFGARFFLPARWSGEGSTAIYVAREDYERELAYMDRFIQPGDVVVDAGANFGIYTVVAARLTGTTGRVLSFEPNPQVMPILRRNVALNDLGNVRLHQCAMSDTDGQARLYHYADSGPVSYAIAPGETGQKGSDEVATLTLDSALHREALDRVDFIKLDIEGAELAALRGAAALLEKSRPIILFELNAEAALRFNLEPEAAWRHLEGLGYAFFALDTQGQLQPLTEPPAEEQWEFQNVMALHPDHGARCAEES